MGMRAEVRKATRTVKNAFAPDEAPDRRDILNTLKTEHDEVKALLSQLQDAETSGERKSLVEKIKQALIPHTKAEEKVVYDAVIALRDKDAQTDGHEGYLEHEWASKTLERLGKITPSTSPEHRAAAKVLKELVEHHIQEEENNVWSDVEDHFSDDERLQMNRDFEAAKKRVKVS
jgi:hemerythrin-like domain-containing protein